MNEIFVSHDVCYIRIIFLFQNKTTHRLDVNRLNYGVRITLVTSGECFWLFA
jgi:hypothetical protein